MCILKWATVYRQTIGIPMGTDCAPQLANLFLFHYEYSYMKGLMRDNVCMAKRFSDTVRYIDDLLTRRNLTEMLHVLGEQTDMKTELYQTKVKSKGVIYRASFQHRLH